MQQYCLILLRNASRRVILLLYASDSRGYGWRLLDELKPAAENKLRVLAWCACSRSTSHFSFIQASYLPLHALTMLWSRRYNQDWSVSLQACTQLHSRASYNFCIFHSLCKRLDDCFLNYYLISMRCHSPPCGGSIDLSTPSPKYHRYFAVHMYWQHLHGRLLLEDTAT